MNTDKRSDKAQPQGMGDCGREKYWSELSIEEKIERMRGEVRQAHAQINTLREENRLLQSHTHQDGKMMVPMVQHSQHIPVGRSGHGIGDDVYF